MPRPVSAGGVADGALAGVDDPVRLVAAAVVLERPAEQVRVEVDELLWLGRVDLEVDDEVGHGGLLPRSVRVTTSMAAGRPFDWRLKRQEGHRRR